jgi:hypothetical protein
MKRLSDQELLEVWEGGLTQSPIHQALLLLNAACPELSAQAVAELSVGQRDSYLLTLHEWLFGSRLVSLANCPACGEQAELTSSLTRPLVNSTSCGPGRFSKVFP